MGLYEYGGPCRRAVACAPHEPTSSGLRRELGLLDATVINAGTMVPSAIFIVPSTIAVGFGSSTPSLLTGWSEDQCRLQIHAGQPMRIEFTNAWFKPL